MSIRRARLAATVAVLFTATATGSAAMANGEVENSGRNTIQEDLTGYEETPLALSTTGGGQFRVQLGRSGEEISYRLAYHDLEGPVTQAHIHLGNRSQSGGVSVFLCSNLGNGPVGTQACPEAPATVTGTLTPADVIGPAGQGIAAGEFAELVRAIRAGATYVNVHSAKYPAGEVRAQLGHQH